MKTLLVLLCASSLWAASVKPRGKPRRYSVSIAWMASQSTVDGYRIYRAVAPGGPYMLLNLNLATGGSYEDSTVQNGATYFYVATAVDANNAESEYSNEASAVIPNR